MPDFNKVILIGNLTKDPELRYTPSGTAVLDLSLAINRRYKTKEGEQKEEVAFIGCTAWGRTAELITQYMHKGSSIFIEGRLTQEEYENKEGKKVSKTKVIIENVQFLGKKEEELPPEG